MWDYDCVVIASTGSLLLRGISTASRQGNRLSDCSDLPSHLWTDLVRRISEMSVNATRTQAEDDAASTALAFHLCQNVVAALKRQSDTPWDIAVAKIACKELQQDGTV
jgi:hypothetical protein